MSVPGRGEFRDEDVVSAFIEADVLLNNLYSCCG